MAAKRQADEVDEQRTERKTCFVIMPISDVDGYPPGHFNEVYKQLIEPAVSAAGYDCSLATSTSSAHMIQLEVVTKVATADLCICDLSTNNPNVLFEYGIRQAFDKPTVLIKDDKTRRIFDLNGFRDIEYDHSLRIANTLAKREAITKAIEDTVSGADDGEQVFSLVQLMKLTKAALPSGEVSKDDARFALLEKKLDTLIGFKNTEADSARFGRAPISLVRDRPTRSEVEFSVRYRVKFEPDTVTVFDEYDHTATAYHSQPEIESSDFWRRMKKDQREAFFQFLSERSPNFIPV